MPVINQRSCQPCTACCEGWLDIKTFEVQAHLGKPCTNCSNQGCGIYDARPADPCQSFHCAWRMEGTLLPLTMRPDLSGAIVMMNQLRWQDEDVIVAVARGARIPARTVHWLCSLAKLTDRPLVMVEFKQDAQGFNGEFNLHTIGPDDFKEAMVIYFSEQGFTGTPALNQERVIALTPL